MSTLNDVGGLPEVTTGGFLQPKLTNRWRVTFLGFGDDPGATPLSLQATKVTRPDLKFDVQTMHRYNSFANVLGKHSLGDLSVTVMDDLSSTATKLLQAQLQRQQFIIGAEGPYLASAQEGSMYKFATVLDLLNGNDLVAESWTYEGCMIASAKWADVDYGKSEIMTIDISMKIDHMFQCFPNFVTPGIALGGNGIPC